MSQKSDTSASRDSAQRSLGFVGLSAMLHVVILFVVALTPSLKSQNAALGEPNGAQAGEAVDFTESQAADPAPAAPQEVLIADNADTTAVAVSAPVIPKKIIAAPAPVETEVSQENLPEQLSPPVLEDESSEITQAAESEQPPAEAAPLMQVASNETAEASADATESASTFSAESPTQDSEPVQIAIPSEETSAPAPAAAPAVNAANANGAGTAGKSEGGAAGTLGVQAGAPTGSAIRDVTELIALPGNVKPTYPVQDKLLGKQGTAILIGEVQADGTVGQITLEQSSGSKQMDASAAKAFKNWKFKPGQAGLVRSPFQFQLVGDAKEVPSKLRRR